MSDCAAIHGALRIRCQLPPRHVPPLHVAVEEQEGIYPQTMLDGGLLYRKTLTTISWLEVEMSTVAAGRDSREWRAALGR